MNKDELIYVIPAGQYGKEGILALLKQHPEIQFVSLVGVDLAGNDTDEKIPISVFFEDYDKFFNATACQTDGSSVVLPGIATLSNARVDIKADPGVNWFVDYNDENIDKGTGKPVGTLRIPSFLHHASGYIDSRSILRNTVQHVGEQILSLLKEFGMQGIAVPVEDIERIVFTTATELEFWVKTPSQDVASRLLSASQKLQEQYWQRTHGVVRTALEQTITRLHDYGLQPEMGHKEVGGIKAHIDDSGKLIFVLEQLEVDWKYSHDPVQTADNEIQARIIIREVFRENGLDVTFQAKPIPDVPTRNRSVLAGLIRSVEAPLATRIEMRAPNPFTNTYIAIALFYLAALHGIDYVLRANKTSAELLQELSKEPGEEATYLEKDRAYRSEVDVFEHFNEAERNARFGKAPKTVWENFKALDIYPEKWDDLVCPAFERRIMESFRLGALNRWALELQYRIIPENLTKVIGAHKLHDDNDGNQLEINRWMKINALRTELGRDTECGLSIFSRIKQALNEKNYDEASDLMAIMSDKMEELNELYYEYSHNAF